MTKVTRREGLALGIASLAALSAAPPASAAIGLVPGTKLYEHTFLKAKPGQRANLAEFIIANWFPIDRKGMEEGIFTSFWLLEETGDNPAWDFVMVVGYPTDMGYGDPSTAAKFQEIRKAHVEVKIDGKSMQDLGEFVGNHRLKVVPETAPRT